jgi:hypothetical protein
MRRIAHVATYPARIEGLPGMLESVAGQMDEVMVVLNEYSSAELDRLPTFSNVVFHVPDVDLKDTGKFLWDRGPGDYVFLVDDDIHYPRDYADRLIAFYERLPSERFVVGLHGVVYSDMFEGAPHSRFVAKFDKALARPMLVNQLGTGCSMARGDLLPPFEAMRTSQRFVDVRFARLCHEAGIGMVCVPRADGWLEDTEPEESIFDSYTRVHHKEQLEEVLVFGGFGKLDPAAAVAVERL